MEAYVSATALIRDAKAAAEQNADSAMHVLCKGDLNRMNGKIPFDAMQQGDEAANAVVSRYFEYLAQTIANFVNLFRPDLVLLSGGICNQGRKLTDPLNERLGSLCFGTDKSFIPEIRCATLGNLAGIIGASNLVNI